MHDPAIFIMEWDLLCMTAWRLPMIGIKLANGSFHTIFQSEKPGNSSIVLTPAVPGAHPITLSLYSYNTESGDDARPLGSLRCNASGGDLQFWSTLDDFGQISVSLKDSGNQEEVREVFDCTHSPANLFLDAAQEHVSLVEPDEQGWMDDQDDQDTHDDQDDQDEWNEEAVPERKTSPWVVAGVSFLVLAACFAGAYVVFLVLKSPPFPLLHSIP